MNYTLRATRLAAALATISCILCNARMPAWSGFTSLSDQFLGLMLALSLCALFIWMRDCHPKANRASFVWCGCFLLEALCDTLLVREHTFRLAAHNKAEIEHERAADKPARARVASVEGNVQE